MKKFLKEYYPYLVIILVVVLVRTFLVTPGLVNGDSSGNKMYKKVITREEFIAVLYRALHRNIID